VNNYSPLIEKGAVPRRYADGDVAGLAVKGDGCEAVVGVPPLLARVTFLPFMPNALRSASVLSAV
jgi:hypothetical protein